MKNRARAALAAVACLVVLSGCVKIDADLEVNSDETVSGKLQLGVDKQLVQASRQSLDQVRQQIESGIKQTSTEGVECKAFEDDRFVGSSCELDKVPFSKLSSSTGDGLTFRKDGDEFVVTVKVNAGTFNRFPQTGQQPQVKFRITMPGKITSHDQGASVSGRTATYDNLEKLGGVSLRSEAGGGFPLWALILIVVLLLAAIGAVVFLVRRGRTGGQQPPYPGQYPPGQYPQGQYPPGQYPQGQPPQQGQQQWGPQYGTQPGEQPMQYGQPGQPMQYGQPNQPMQYGQPGPGQQPGQQGQAPPYGQPGPGQYPAQPPQGGWGQPPQPPPGSGSGQPPRGNGGGGPEQS